MHSLRLTKATRYLIEFVIAFWMHSFVVAMYIVGYESTLLAPIFFLLLGAGMVLIVFITRSRPICASIPKSLLAGVLILNLAIVFSYIANGERYESSFMLGNMLSSWLMLIAVYVLATRTELDVRVTLVIYCILTCALLPLILAKSEMRWGRLFPRDFHPNFVGMIALISFVGALGMRSKIGALGLSVLPIYTMWIVSSRASLLMAFLAAGITGWISLRRARPRVAVMWSIALVTLACILAASALLGGPVSRAINYLGEDVFLVDDEHRGLATGGSGRTDLWAAGLDLWMKNPIFGVGFKGHQLLMPDEMPAHNAYLGVLADMGLCGILGYLLIVCVPLYYLFRRGNAWSDYPQRATIMLTFVAYGLIEPRGFGFGNPYSIIFFLAAFDSCKKPILTQAAQPSPLERVPVTEERLHTRRAERFR
jgi:O-antigen ligase